MADGTVWWGALHLRCSVTFTPEPELQLSYRDVFICSRQTVLFCADYFHWAGGGINTGEGGGRGCLDFQHPQQGRQITTRRLQAREC